MTGTDAASPRMLLLRPRAAADGCHNQLDAYKDAEEHARQARAALLDANGKASSAHANVIRAHSAEVADQNERTLAQHDLEDAQPGYDDAQSKLNDATSETAAAQTTATQAKQSLDTCTAANGPRSASCAPQRGTYKQAASDFTAKKAAERDAQREANRWSKRLVQLQGTLDKIDKALAQDRQNEQDADMDAQIADDAVTQAQKDDDAAQADLAAARAALQECRKHHPAHECGERGGPGFRRPRGKCAGWDDWK